MNGRLYRSRDERVIAGVAGGLADYFDLDPSIVRVLWVILAVFSGGAFLIVYIVMALVVPEEPWEGYAPMPGPMATGEPMAPGGTMPPAEGEAGGAMPSGETAPGPAGSPAAGPLAPGWHAPDWRTQRAAWRAQRRAERAAWRAQGGDGGRTGGLVFGAILVAVGVFFLVPILWPGVAIGRFWPLILVALGVVLVLTALRPGGPRGR